MTISWPRLLAGGAQHASLTVQPRGLPRREAFHDALRSTESAICLWLFSGKLCALDIHLGLVTSPFKGCPIYLSTALLKILPEIDRCTQNMILQLSQWEKIWNASRICVSSLRRGHANLLCIVPILVYVLPLSEHVYRAYRAQYILDSIVRRWTLWDLLGLGA